MRRGTYLVCFLIGLTLALLTACTPQESEALESRPTESPVVETSEESPPLPPEVVLDARAWLAEQRGIPVEQIRIEEAQFAQEAWSDSCLGLGRANESCMAVVTPGWRVIFNIDGQAVEVRTDETGEIMRLAEPPAPQGGTSELEGSRWQLVSSGPPGDESPVVEASSVTLAFVGNRAEGNGGCNSYGGTYQVDGDRISFSDITSTMMACVDNQVTEQEQRYFQALEQADTFELLDGRLLITYDDGLGILVFESAAS